MPLWMAYALQLGSCNTVPLLCGGWLVQGTRPYTSLHQTVPTSWVPVDKCPQQYTTTPRGTPMLPRSAESIQNSWT